MNVQRYWLVAGALLSLCAVNAGPHPSGMYNTNTLKNDVYNAGDDDVYDPSGPCVASQHHRGKEELTTDTAARFVGGKAVDRSEEAYHNFSLGVCLSDSGFYNRGLRGGDLLLP